ncbi:unnamed protein product [Agarophyton chilense]
MASFYELVVFTSNLNSFADPILDKLDPNMDVSHRLYRHETHYQHGVHIKDLSALNRDLSRVIVLDHDAKHTSLHPQNAIIIPKWTGDTSDTALLDLIPLLESLVRRDVPDVREPIAALKGRPIAEAVAEYTAMESDHHTRARSAAGSLFGRALRTNDTPDTSAATAATAAAAAAADDDDDDDDDADADEGGASDKPDAAARPPRTVWGSLPNSSIFSRSTHAGSRN